MFLNLRKYQCLALFIKVFSKYTTHSIKTCTLGQRFSNSLLQPLLVPESENFNNKMYSNGLQEDHLLDCERKKFENYCSRESNFYNKNLISLQLKHFNPFLNIQIY